MKISELFEKHLEFRAKEGNCTKTIDEHRRFLYGPIQAAVGDKELGSINMLVRADLIEAGKRYGIYGSQRAVVYFRQLLQYAKMAGLNPPVDWRDINVPAVPQKRVEYLSPDELNRVRACFDLKDEAGLRTRTLLELMLGTGLRIGEACSLNISDIRPNQYDPSQYEIRVINCKTDEEEIVPLNQNVMNWINLYLETRHDDLPCLFVSGRARLIPCTSRNFIRSKTKHLNLGKRIAHHIFRKTCATYLLEEKVEIQAVRDYLRHKSERTTLRYYSAVKKNRNREVAREIMQKFILDPMLTVAC